MYIFPIIHSAQLHQLSQLLGSDFCLLDVHRTKRESRKKNGEAHKICMWSNRCYMV